MSRVERKHNPKKLGAGSQVSLAPRQVAPTMVCIRVATQRQQKKRGITEEAQKKILTVAAQPFTLALPLQEKDKAATLYGTGKGPSTQQAGHTSYDSQSNQPPWPFLSHAWPQSTQGQVAGPWCHRGS